MKKLSPMMQQYMEIKQNHKDHILFFRLGDFYEMFFDDAIKASKELELTLTGRDCGMEERAPMCGVPYHSSQAYIKRLIEKGFKVAICEQTETPEQVKGKGIVKREVVKVITPGTITDTLMLDEERNNFICSIFVKGKRFSISFADISTGDVYTTELESKNIQMDLINEISKFLPSEILFNSEFVSFNEVSKYLKSKLNCVAEMLEDEKFDIKKGEQNLLKHFNINSLKELSLEDKPLCVSSLYALMSYIDYTQKDAVNRIIFINLYNEQQFMSIDITAKRNLELTETMRNKEKRGSLLWVLDKTKTAMGKRFIRKAIEQPLVNLSHIVRRQNAVKELFDSIIVRDELSETLSKVYDLERLMTKVIYGSVNPRELKSLSYTALTIPIIKKITSKFNCEQLKEINQNINDLQDICNVIDNAINDEPPISLKDGGVIKTGFNKELDEYRNLLSNAKQILTEIELKEKEKTGIKNLKIGYNKIFGYYIEVTKANAHLVPDEYIRKQTLTNYERYITGDLKELEYKVLSANEKISGLESDIFDEIRKYVATKLHIIQNTATAIANLDFLVSLAQTAFENSYVCPEMVLDGNINIIDGRHPVVEKMLDCPFVPNDTNLDNKNNFIALITGPNMAGKSTYMRQVAIITLMAQIGSFVPAKSAKITLVDKIFTRVGASDDLASGQSTFMVEMSEVAHILKNATSQSLVILDEIGRGTSTFDGMSIAQSVIEYIIKNKKIKCKTLFATHYHELTMLEKTLTGVKNYNIAVKKRGDDIIFLRKIVEGGADDSFGIEVAKLAGVPDDVVERAKQILFELENGNKMNLCQDDIKVEKNAIEENQMNLLNQNNDVVKQKIKNIDLNVLTPIEAMNLLFELKKMVN